jgi:hypothetical protein
MRFLSSDFSLVPFPTVPYMPSTSDPNPRSFAFTTPPNFPTNFSTPPRPTEGWGSGSTSGLPFPDGALAQNSWSYLSNDFNTSNTCALDSVAYGSSGVQVTLDSYVWQMPMPATVDQALQVALDWWGSTSRAPPEQFSIGAFELTMNMHGGQFDGQPVKLKAALASAVVPDPYAQPPDAAGGYADLFFAVDWGSDPATNREFVIFHFSFFDYAATTDTSCLPLEAICQRWVSEPDPATFEQAMVDNLTSQLFAGSAYFQGAPPELLFFYDFSQDHTVPVLSTIPGTPISSGLYYYYIYANQYDAGPSFSLPTAGSDPRPGGNACGVASLTMAMNAAGATEHDVRQVYANVMQYGLTSNGMDNGLLWPRAQAWFQGRTNYEGTAFPNPLNYALPVDFIDISQSISAGWGQVDSLLAGRQPVLIRTDLGAGTAPGSGHVVLLLGKGHSDYMTQLYGGSGNYYIVNDSAGHYFANPSGGKHYLTAEQLNQEFQGINYGGWFAMYPAETLQTRIHNPAGNLELRALTIGAPFSSSLQVQVQSPVAMMVTDPLGRQTGIDTNGTIVEGIAQSSYEAAIADSEDGVSIDPTGPKTVRVQTAMAGTYRVDLTGTNSGAYTLVWSQMSANGTVVASNSYAGSVAPGQQLTYLLTAPPAGPPLLLFSEQGKALVLSWTTNYVGFSLQTTTNLAGNSTWANVSGVAVVGGFNVFTNQMLSQLQFFRLKQ